MGGTYSGSGPDLANHSGVQTLDQAEQWYRARAARAYLSATRGKLAWLICVDIFIVGVLALTGYPALRVVALSASVG